MEIDKEYLGYELLNRGFETWFRYMFRIIEGTPFIVEPIHHDLFKAFQDIYDGKITRINVNIPPRAGKTTLGKYWQAYCITKNPKCNFIYTSFSQQLLDDIARSIMAIMEHPAYKAMYNNFVSAEEIEVSPIDEFWADYLYQTQKKTVYSQKKIVTKAGGVLLFTSIGSTITGFGAGIRGASKFSGALLVDDANKPADIHSQTMRERVIRYYEETLLSRLNGSDVPIVNIQQRLHIEDLSGILANKYGFEVLSIRSYAEVAQKLVELGAKTDKVFDWLKSFKDFHLDNLEFDAETAGLEVYDDITDDVMSEFQAQNEWEESKHPRAKDGKFGSGGGSSGQKEDTGNKISDFLGKEFTGVKGQAAIDKLMQEKQGHVKGAFTRKDIGDIDLVWGNEGMGLAHIIKRRKETKQPLGKLLLSLTDVIEKGELTIQDNQRFALRYKGKTAIIEPQIKNNRLTFLFTAYYE